MSKTWYKELLCECCSIHMGYYIDSGPGSGCAICDGCYEKEPDEDD